MSFDFEFEASDLEDCMDNIQDAEGWFASLSTILPSYQITTVQRVAMFIAQTGHESMDFTALHENLNYRADQLVAVFPRYFSNVDPNAYAHQPEKIANRVYGNRMGNGDEESGDGWKFCGRGILQVTGKDNYAACSKAIYGDDRLLENPDLLSEKDGAIASACWFWSLRHLNEWTDQGNIKEVTRRINGGYNGLDDREQRYQKAIDALS